MIKARFGTDAPWETNRVLSATSSRPRTPASRRPARCTQARPVSVNQFHHVIRMFRSYFHWTPSAILIDDLLRSDRKNSNNRKNPIAGCSKMRWFQITLIFNEDNDTWKVLSKLTYVESRVTRERDYTTPVYNYEIQHADFWLAMLFARFLIVNAVL